MRRASALLAAAMLALAGSGARAECYDILGCSGHDRFAAHFEYLASVEDGPTCEFLFTMRNAIYKEHGYCFDTARGRATFGNEGCRFRDIAAVPLSGIERANIATIARAERLKACR